MSVTLDLSQLLCLLGSPSPRLRGGQVGDSENACETVALGSPHKSSFLLRLVTSSPGRALLNVQLHSTEGF